MEALKKNPFYILELRPDCSAMDVKRQGQKLLGMMQLGLSSAKRYPTPFGKQERSETDIRNAIAALRDPDKRLLFEIWASLSPKTDIPSVPEEEPVERAGWSKGFPILKTWREQG